MPLDVLAACDMNPLCLAHSFAVIPLWAHTPCEVSREDSVAKYSPRMINTVSFDSLQKSLFPHSSAQKTQKRRPLLAGKSAYLITSKIYALWDFHPNYLEPGKFIKLNIQRFLPLNQKFIGNIEMTKDWCGELISEMFCESLLFACSLNATLIFLALKWWTAFSMNTFWQKIIIHTGLFCGIGGLCLVNIWNKLVCVVRIKFFISGEIFESYAIVLTWT